MNTAQNYSTLVPSTGEVIATSVGAYKYIFFRSAPYDFRFSFDGVSYFDGYEGLNMGPLPITTTQVFLQNIYTVTCAAPVKFYVSNFPILSPPNVIQVRPALTYPLGNMGFASQNDINANEGYYLSSISISNRGTRYTPHNHLTLAGGTCSKAAVIEVLSVGVNGEITDARIFTPGNYSVQPSTPNSATGGSGTAASIGLTWTHLTSAVLGYSTGYLTITNADVFSIPNINNGNARRSVTFSVPTASASALLVLDANGLTFAVISPGQILVFEDSASFGITSASASTCTFAIGEEYFA
jgi:hypothetical protein